MTVEIRRLSVRELPDALPLLAPEGWDFTLPEIARLHRLGGAVGAYEGGVLRGFLTFVDFPPVRWVGNVVVAPALRGKGAGAKMVEEAIRDAPVVGLYAVEKAVTLYERAGFVARGEAWAHRAEAAAPRAPSATEPFTRDDLLDVSRLDRVISGMDRGYLIRELLAAYPDTARIVRHGDELVGFGFAKPSPGLTEIGPIVARSPDIGASILDALLALTEGPHEMTILGANVKARHEASLRGFAPMFRTVVMFRGTPPGWHDRALTAAAGLEKT